MSEEHPQGGFVCKHCRRNVSLVSHGTRHRNHCPWCLWSLHVAQSRKQHDRMSQCQDVMEPIGISTQSDGEWSLVHRCRGCGVIKTNRIAGDDDTIALLCLALRPLAHLPFPLDTLPAEYRSQLRTLDQSAT